MGGLGPSPLGAPVRFLLLAWVGLQGCDGPQAGAPADPAALLTRASLDLRGVRPSVAELAAAAEDPTAVDRSISLWLTQPALGDRVQALWSPIWLTQADTYLVPAASFGVEDEAAFHRSLGEQPLRVLARTVTADLPYAAVITADWTLADPLLEEILPLERAAGEGWTLARYTDYRPHLGAASSPGFWMRYTSTEFNAQRGRANALSRILLCDDYLARPIPLAGGVDLLDQEAAQEAISTDPGCVACHETLDPIAGALWGYHQMFDEVPTEFAWYHPEREAWWQLWSGVPPGFGGAPLDGASELGEALTQSPNFSACAVRQTRRLLLQDEVSVFAEPGLSTTEQAWEDSGGRLRALLGSVTQDPLWRGVGTEKAGPVGRKLMRADLVESSFVGLVGAELRIDGWGLTDNDRVGVRTLAGGVDGRFQTEPSDQPTPTMVLVQARLAEAVAGLATGPDRMGALFGSTALSSGLTDAAWTDQHRTLTLQVLSRAPSAEEAEADRALYTAVLETGAGPDEAWQAVLAALLRDPSALWY